MTHEKRGIRDGVAGDDMSRTANSCGQFLGEKRLPDARISQQHEVGKPECRSGFLGQPGCPQDQVRHFVEMRRNFRNFGYPSQHRLVDPQQLPIGSARIMRQPVDCLDPDEFFRG